MIGQCFRRLAAAAAFGAALAAALPAAANPSLLFELETGKVLSHTDAFRRWHPASLTKLMTAYVTFRALGAGELALNSPVRMSRNSANEPPSKMGFQPGQVMTLDNALKMMIIKSANDIAMAVAENVGGSEKAFVARMNAEAARLGMTGSHFTNPNGLHSPEQYTTARDLGLLVSAIRKEYPQYASYFAIEGLTAGKKVMKSYNMLVARRFSGADGMKTGFVCPSGFNMIGSATRGGRTLVAVVLGASTARGRAEFAAGMLTDGFAGALKPGEALPALAAYGNSKAPPPNMRAEICGKKKKTQSEASADDEEDRSKLLPAPPLALKLVAVGLGGAGGPVPKAVRDREEALDLAEIPVPTPRPDYPEQPEVKAAAEGDTASN
ncbi:MAG: D-alanyl-D-alanine carboxypeptidase family protein [Rhizobiaceae bacterium]